MDFLRSKGLKIFFTLTMVLATFVPSVVQAYEIIGQSDNPKLTIHKYSQEPKSDDIDWEVPDDAEPEDITRELPNNGEKGNGKAGQSIPEGANPLPGVTFELKMTHKYDKDSDTWTAVENGKTLQGVTNEEGVITFTKDNGLELGRYEVSEVSGPEHVILNKEKFSVDIPMTNEDGTELNYDVHIYPKNEIVRGDAELIKKDADGNALPGVEFILYSEDGEEIEKLVTDENGKISVSGLASGKYYFKEHKAAPDFALNNTKLEFEVKNNSGAVEVTWTPQDKYLTENGEFTNYKKPEIEKDVEEKEHHSVDRDKTYTYNLTIKTPMDIENYSLLAVTDKLDDRLEYAGSWEVSGTTKDNIDFKQEGQTLIWEVKDLSQLAPGQDVKISFTSKIKKDAVLNPDETGIPNTAKLDFDNDKGSYTKPKDPTNPPLTPPEEPPTTPPVTVDPTEGGLKVIKVDKKDSSKKLEGAEFKLTTDKEGKNVVDASGTIIKVNGNSHDGKLENLATGKDGEISITGLTPGTYYLHETKAPTYQENGETKSYRLLTKPLEVEVKNKVNDHEVTVENSKSGWDLPTTGGMGTILFTAAGLGFMLLALVLYNKREEEPAV